MTTNIVTNNTSNFDFKTALAIFPKEVITLIFKHLPPSVIPALKRTCKDIKAVIENPHEYPNVESAMCRGVRDMVQAVYGLTLLPLKFLPDLGSLKMDLLYLYHHRIAIMNDYKPGTFRLSVNHTTFSFRGLNGIDKGCTARDMKEVATKLKLSSAAHLYLPDLFHPASIRWNPPEDVFAVAKKNFPAWFNKNSAALSAIKQLDLSGCYLRRLPEELGTLTNLEELDLGVNKLHELPKWIGNLKKLRILKLNNNKLNALPKEIYDLPCLEKLDLSTNELTELPKEIGKLTTLTHLNLDTNDLQELPPEIGKLTELTELILWENYLKRLPKEIASLTKLTELDISDNPPVELPEELGTLTGLTKFRLSSDSVPALPEKLRDHSSLVVNKASHIPSLEEWHNDHLLEFVKPESTNLCEMMGKYSAIQQSNKRPGSDDIDPTQTKRQKTD